MKMEFLSEQQKVGTESNLKTQPKQGKHQRSLTLINEYTQLDFKTAVDIKTIVPAINFATRDLKNSIYTIVPKSNLLSYEAFDFISDAFRTIHFYYQENHTIILINGCLKDSYEVLKKKLAELLEGRENLKLRFEILCDSLEVEIEKINEKIGFEFETAVLDLTTIALNLLQIAVSFKLPENYPSRVQQNRADFIPEMKTLLSVYGDKSAVMDTNLKEEGFEHLFRELNKSTGVSSEVTQEMLENAENWQGRAMFLLIQCAQSNLEKCFDHTYALYHVSSAGKRKELFLQYYRCARNFLTAVHEKFTRLKQHCGFKANSYDLYLIFALDTMINVIVIDPSDIETEMRTEERNILTYVDRYVKGGKFIASHLLLSHIAMVKIGLHRKDSNLIDQHFTQFKEILRANNKTEDLNAFLLTSVPDIIKQACVYYENSQDFRKASEIAAGLNFIMNTAYKRIEEFAISLNEARSQRQLFEPFIELVSNDVRNIKLRKYLRTHVPIEFFKEEKDKISHFCRIKLSEFIPKLTNRFITKEASVPQLTNEEVSKCEPKNLTTSLEPLQSALIDEPTLEIQPISPEKLDEVKKSVSLSIQYSTQHILWSSLNKKLNIEATLNMEACEAMTLEEQNAALQILQSGRITGAIGNGIKLVTEEEQKQHNLKNYFYKIKHVGLNFRVYGRLIEKNEKKLVIFDHPIRGHKNHSKNTPGNVESRSTVVTTPG